ncbi:hypothetical protein [Paeniglutamicibacter psychrophenolicus]|uniref:hypothetical protein n=1 Tax=Paeniglutamicibacter psychrophenolicus TaxID=257454 RepID=UPI00277FED89|nr:hypothetical protein [Paeniglutamicibacter psychrophenolicus]MDQ0094173.1 hypothetical protein [Paeniglutamicibacter psychrophenolicus]
MNKPLLGASAGLAWSATMRVYMHNLAGNQAELDRMKTGVGIMLPGALTGALLARAAQLRVRDRNRNLDAYAAAPLLFAACTLPLPGMMRKLIETGEGSNAVAMPLLGMAGGMALAGRGPRWARLASNAVVIGHVPLMAFLGPKFFFPEPPTARQRVGFALNTVIYAAALAVLAAGCAVPLRRQASEQHTVVPAQEAELHPG